MHHALHLPEIRQEICDQVETLDSLTVLARICTAFKVPSLNRIWSGVIQPVRMEDILNVMSDAAERDDKRIMVDLVLTKDKDWSPAYLRQTLAKTGVPTFQFTANFPKTSPPTPGEVFRNCENATQVLQCAMERCPQLEVLEVVERLPPHSAVDRRILIGAISHTVGRLPLLTKLQSPDLRRFAFVNTHLSSSLRELTLTCMEMLAVFDTQNDPVQKLPDGALRNVRNLELSPRDIDDAVTLLRMISPSLAKLKVATSAFPLSHITTIFWLLSQPHQLPSALEELVIEGDAMIYDLPSYPVTFTMEALRPLTYHRRLRKLSLRVGYHIMLTLDDVQELAMAWPNLEDLTIASGPSSSLTIESVALFSQHCPKLVHISLPIY
ncbi:hypothetical protein CONPUDRAFT_140760 [Coniophora puteana RWD-64-598 SS2]|uniref:F-box domain-containing protein n=1 Tax=Coniophora puteana (strain RWD-64-598) TaxID=741705 RepID=A0A5M3N4J5_CONPW|nr:uncharacterized protein CONPUDRAFT_140760 [Coniophora puteana RWD-64-598 SS2]EIW85974.1 hypothetical protein CONPUDRAFT_140760 [Coniophora puteana RWD-64-598 SS2]